MAAMDVFKVKIPILQGATLAETYTYKVGKPAVPVDLTGCTARMQVRDKLESPAVLLELTTENGGITLGGAAGTIALHVSAEDTAAIPWRSGVYDLELVFADGTVKRLIEGSVSVRPEVTR